MRASDVEQKKTRQGRARSKTDENPPALIPSYKSDKPEKSKKSSDKKLGKSAILGKSIGRLFRPSARSSAASSQQTLFTPRTILNANEITLEAIDDVDHNLMRLETDPYGLEEETEVKINPDIFFFFVEHNILRHILCSDMSKFSRAEMGYRQKLLDKMAAHHLEVLCVITTPDLVWHIDGQLLKDFMTDCDRAGVKLNFNADTKNLDLVLDKTVKIRKDGEEKEVFVYQAIRDLYDPKFKNFGIFRLGATFREISDAMKPDSPTAADLPLLQEKAYHAKWAVDIVALKSNRPSTKGVKGLLLRPLFAQKQAENKTCHLLFTDDKKTEITVAQEEAEKWDKIKLYCLNTPEFEQASAKDYAEQLNAQLFKKPARSVDFSATPPSTAATTPHETSPEAGSTPSASPPMKPKAHSEGDSPDDQLSGSTSRSSQNRGKFG